MKKSDVSESRLSVFLNTLLEEVATDPHVVKPAADRLVQRAHKKARFVNPDLAIKAVNEFIADNNRVGNFLVTLDQDIIANARHFITVMLERATTKYDPSLIQETLSTSFLYENWRFGPGASHEVSGTHAADKIYESMTCTTSCVPLVSNLRRSNPYFSGYDSQNKNMGMTVVSGSKLTTVPKNQDTERTIAIEPSGNMVLQLAAGRYLEETLRYLGLDITSQQPKNQELARRGSIDGSLATLDLKSASNMIGPELVRLLFPAKWYDLLMALRSQEIKLPDAGWLRLHMMSTMGNGFTFPLMTFIITALIYAYRCRKPSNPTLYVDWKRTAVFGDDIIIPVDEYELCVDTLERAGFVINHDKSYREGPFRESCGGDFYAGVNVTPFYVKSLATDSEVYVAINQVLDWSVRNNCFLPASLNLLASFLRGKVHLVPEWHNPDEGVLTQVCNRRYSYLKLRQEHKTLLNEYFAFPLAVAGYISTAEANRTYNSQAEAIDVAAIPPSAPDMVYLPRSNKTRYRVRYARLPKGYLDGWDPLTRSQAHSSMVALHIRLTFGYVA